MNPSGLSPRWEKIGDFTNHACADFVTMAEREFSAFFWAVTELFGPEQAELSAQDWLHELTESDGLPASIRELRRISAKVSSRLASRVHPLSLLTEAQS